MATNNDEFIPYAYIKEFYNTERLILPAVRNNIINGVFLGGANSTEKGDTLLDTVNYPIFDLWAFIINQYKYSFFETTRSELIVVPDMMSCLPPLCNVVFPDEYVHYGRNIDLRGITTRFFDQGYMTLSGNDAVIGSDINNLDKQETAQQAFVAPTSDVEPWIYEVIAGECTPKEVPSSVEGDNFEVYSQIPLPEEFHYGANYKTGSGEYLSRMAEDWTRTKLGNNTDDSGVSTKGTDTNQDAESEESINLIKEYDDYHKLNVLYKYFLSRLYSQKTENIRLTFTPRLVAGLPILLLSRTGRHLLGLLTNLSHHISAEGISETIITVEYQYNYDDITKRPVYFYRQGDREKLIQQNEDSSDESTYVWKNYYMLSAYFRDQHIGGKMYKSILCDDINQNDYSPYALKGLKNQSILGILNSNGDIDPDLLTDAKKKSYIGDPQQELDKAYFDQDRSNDVGEVQSIPVGSEQGVGLKPEMLKQQKRMAAAIEKIWAGYLSAPNKDVYRAKFDIYPLRDFDYWMRDLGATRQNNGDFKGNETSIDWVALAQKEKDSRFGKYSQKQEKNEEENKNKQINSFNNKITDLESQKAELERKEKLLKEQENQNKLFIPKDIVLRDKTYVKPKIEELPKQTPDDIQKEIDDTKKSRLDTEKELDAAKNALDKLLSSQSSTESNWKHNQDLLTYNNYYKEYDLHKRSFTTNGPFCIEKQDYFKNVYAKNLKEVHFDTEFRDFEKQHLKGKDRGNSIQIIHQKKGTGYIAHSSSDSNTTLEEKKKDLKYTEDHKDDELNNQQKIAEQYVAILWVLTWDKNTYEWYKSDTPNLIVINGKVYDRYDTDPEKKEVATAVKDYIYLMDQELDQSWNLVCGDSSLKKHYRWVPASYNYDNKKWKEKNVEEKYQNRNSWDEMIARLSNSMIVGNPLKTAMEHMSAIYQDMVRLKIINPVS